MLRQIFADAQLAHQTLDPRISVEIIRQAASGLSDAHNFVEPEKHEKKPIIHRDISPHNLIVGANGIVKIIDFGIAKSTASDYKTMINQIKGKPAYMSPEQIHGDDTIDARTDIFSLGICLWELIAGKRLYSTENSDYRYILKLYENPEYRIPDLKEENPKIDPELAYIVSTMLQLDPKLRYSTMKEVEEQLKNYQKRSSLDTGAEGLKNYIETSFAQHLAIRRGIVQNALKRYKTALNGGTLKHREATLSGEVAPSYRTQVTTVSPSKKKYIYGSLGLASLLVISALFVFKSEKPAQLTNERPAQVINEKPSEVNTEALSLPADELSRPEKMRLLNLHELKVAVEEKSSPKVGNYLDSLISSGIIRRRRLQFQALSREERISVLDNAEKIFNELLNTPDEAAQMKIIYGASESLRKLPTMRRGDANQTDH